MVFLFTEIHHPEVSPQGGDSEADHALARQHFLIEEILVAQGVKWMQRSPRGVLALFDGGDSAKAALTLQREFQTRTWEPFGKAKLSVALHVGEAEPVGQSYVGPDFNHALRLLEAARGGQILLTVPAVHFIGLPPGGRLKDMGKHFLKDLSEPQTLYLLLHPDLAEVETEPPRSLNGFPQNFFPQTSPFFGRREEMGEITRLLAEPATQLVTLTGPGGFGKTRLAFQAAAEVVEKFKDGVFTVSLAPLLSDQLLIGSLANAIKFFFFGVEDPKTQLLNHLREKEMLLVMDNFEHIIEGAELVEEILIAAPRVKIIATSREKLRLAREKVFEVKGLRFPDREEAADFEAASAVQLFLKNAHRIRPGFALSMGDKGDLLTICRLLEGMPLGLELSATWVGTLSLKEIAEKIGNSRDFLATTMPHLPPRHRSLRAVFEYSWILLSEPHKKVLKAISVFKGGFTAQAAAKVAGATEAILGNLADKSLVHQKGERYEVHELLKYYAKEKLFDEPKEKEKALDAHCAYFAWLLETRKREFVGPSERKALEELTAEMGNLREGWARAVEKVLEEELGVYLEGLFFIYETKGWFQEAKEAFQRAVEALKEKYEGQSLPTDSRGLLARLLCRWADFEKNTGDVRKARELYEESLQAFETVPGGPWGWSLAGMGIVSENQGDLRLAKAYYQKGLRAFQRARDRAGIVLSLNHLGHIVSLLGHFQASQKLIQRSLSYSEKDGDQREMGYSYNLMGDALYEQGIFEKARAFYQKGLSAYLEGGDRRGTAWSFTNLGRTAQGLGDYKGARQMYEEGMAVSRDLGDLRSLAWSSNLRGYLDWATGDYEEAERLFEEGLFYYKEVGDPRGQAWALDLMGILKQAQGKDREAETLYRQAYAFLSREGLYPQNKAWHAYHLGTLEISRGNFKAAQGLFRQSLRHFEKLGDALGCAAALIQLGETSLTLGRLGPSRNFLKKGLKAAFQSRQLPFQVDGLIGVAQLLKAEGDERQALGFLLAALSHSTCHQQTKDRMTVFLADLQSRFSPQEIQGATHWAKTTALEDVVLAWLSPGKGLPRGKGLRRAGKKAGRKSKARKKTHAGRRKRKK